MKTTKPKRIRSTVYIVGAGFSAGLGYPLTKSLMIEVWERLPRPAREQLQKIIKFHHPAFDANRATTFPDIEQLLTEVEVNDQLFDASRPAPGRFTRAQLKESRETLLFTIASWFHEIYETAATIDWLSRVMSRFRDDESAVISFNWDLIIDQALFGGGLNAAAYGFSEELHDGPLLLKPHGSLNWYQGTQLERVPDLKRAEIFHHKKTSQCVHAFLRPRGVKSKAGNRYNPLIVPPTYLKDFTPAIFQLLWKNCVDLLSTAEELVFLGYSLPAADLQSQFIFRCGFYNQLHGRLKEDGSRYPATGPAKVIIVNPEQDAARRIEAVAGPEIACTWFPKRIQEWLDQQDD
jgi:hypothetical protein